MAICFEITNAGCFSPTSTGRYPHTIANPTKLLWAYHDGREARRHTLHSSTHYGWRGWGCPSGYISSAPGGGSTSGFISSTPGGGGTSGSVSSTPGGGGTCDGMGEPAMVRGFSKRWAKQPISTETKLTEMGEDDDSKE
ncbi:hypothetical protein EJ110_NYTH04751 [Nymphaea thermarum]|nr:hypothetical protein EJ110_NYTH04751 [Nymphaea thermarum]